MANVTLTQATLEAVSLQVTALFNSGLEDANKQIYIDKIASEKPLPSGRSLKLAASDRAAKLRPRVGGKRARRRQNHYGYELFVSAKEDSIVIHRDDLADDLFGLYADDIQDLGRAVAMARQQRVQEAQIAGTTETGLDGVAFYSASHPKKPGVNGSATFSNLLSLSLTPDNFMVAYKTMETFVDAADENWGFEGSILEVPPSLRVAGENIVKMQRLASGADNPNYNRVELLVTKKLEEDPTRWYLHDCRSSRKPFFYVPRESYVITPRVDLSSPNVVDNEEFEWYVRGRDAAGYDRPQLSITSKP